MKLAFSSLIVLAASSSAHAELVLEGRAAASSYEIEVKSDGEAFKGDASQSGYSLRGHLDLEQGVFVRGRFDRLDLDEAEDDTATFGVDTLRIGIGYDLPTLRSGIEPYLFGEYSNLRYRTEPVEPGSNSDIAGGQFGFGLQSPGGQTFPWQAELSYTRYEEKVSAITIEGSIGYAVNEAFTVLGGVQYRNTFETGVDIDELTYSGGLRWTIQ